LAGYIAALRGLIDMDCRKRLNRLNICLFTPALLFGKVAFSLTPEYINELMGYVTLVPVGFCLVTAVSALVGLILSNLFRVNSSQRAIIVSGSMFMNTNTIPVALIQSLSMSLPILKSQPDDKPEDQLARALSYLLIYGLLGSFVRWSLGVKLFESANEKMEQSLSDHQPSHQIGDNKPDLGFSNSTHTSSPSSSYGQNVVYLHENLDITISLSSQAPQSPLITKHHSEDELACSKSPNRGSTLTEKTLVEHPSIIKYLDVQLRGKGSVFQEVRKICVQVMKGVQHILNPPLISAIAAVIVACIPPLQQFLGKIEPLRHLLNISGSVSIPLTLIALVLLPLYQDHQTKFPKEERKTIILTLISRQLITPILFIPILASLLMYSHLTSFQDPIFVMTAVLVIGGPPATTLAQMSSRTCAEFDRIISRILFWSFSSVT
ncbi:auxin efflux carrier, partial [Melampsora americana]